MRRFITLILILAFFFFSPKSIHAFSKEFFVSFAFPVRELSLPQSTLALPLSLSREASKSATPITWFLNYDVLKNPRSGSFFADLPVFQEKAVLLEVTPALLSDADLPAGSVPLLLNSYLPANRQKLIDLVFGRYYDLFGTYPKSVYASYLDSYSLQYLHDHYSVVSALTDSSGVFPFFPYYPSTQNANIPAQDANHRIKMVMDTLNPPDLFGQPISAADIDQTLYDLSLKDLNQSTRLVLGTDNSTPVDQYLPFFLDLSEAFDRSRDQLGIRQVTQSEFGTWFAQYFPLTSPAYHFRAIRPDRAVMYYQNPFYQIKFEQIGSQTKVTQFTVFHQSQTEEFRNQRNLSNIFRPTVFPLVTADDPVPVSISLDGIYTNSDWRLFLTDGDKQLGFLPSRITTKNLELDLPPIDSSYLPFSTPTPIFILNLLKLFILGFVIYLILKALNIDLKLKIEPWLTLPIVMGSILWSLTTIKSGSHTIFGLSFWGPQGHDAFVHLSLIESFKQSLYPLHNPTLINTTVINYHILFDLLAALISKFLDIPALDLYFRYLPPVLAVSIGLLSAKLLRKWNFSKPATVISLLLIYAAGSLGFVVRGGESAFWSNQAASTLLNPPFALSLTMLLLWLTGFGASLSWKRVLGLSLLGGLLIQTKSYSAVLLLFSLGLFVLISVLKHKLTLQLFTTFFLTSLFAVIFMLPTYAPGQSVFIFSPLWFTHSLVSSPDRLPWPAAANALINYPFNGALSKFILLELLLTTVFFAGNFGIRLFAIPQILKKGQPPERQVINGIIFVGCLLPLLLIQTANPWNTIQFLYYSLFFTALLAGQAIADLLYSFRRLPAFLIVLTLLVVTAFTTTVFTLRDYLSKTPAAYIGYTELLALDRLKSLPRGLVISPAYDPSASRPYVAPKPIFAYISTSYISALTGQPSYIADEINLAISNYRFSSEKADQQRLYRSEDADYLATFLKENDIKYVYENPQFHLRSEIRNLKSIFDSGYFNLYTVTK